MRKPPMLADALLTRFAPADDAIVGDIYEQWPARQSAGWFWRQSISAIGYAALREVRGAPGRAAAAFATGWSVLLVVFRMGDVIAPGIAHAIAGWDSRAGYANDWWWPFWIGALVVSYGGYGLSAWVVARLYRRHQALLIPYVAVNAVLLLVAGIVVNVLTRQGPLPLPHTFFYSVSVTLPYQWYSGLVLVPLAMLVCGTVGARRFAPPAVRLVPPTQ